MDLLDILENRASVRSFRSDPLTEEQGATLLHAAERAPTAGNLQDYSVVLVTSPDLKAKMAGLCWNQPFIKKTPLFMIFNIDQHRSSRWIERSGGRKVFGPGSVYVAIVAGAARSIRQSTSQGGRAPRPVPGLQR